MLTVVTLNWRRPEYTWKNLVEYSAYSVVRQILCFNNGPPLSPPSRLPKKCVLIQATEDLGLYTRLATGALARTEAILHTDDDILLPELTVKALYSSWQHQRKSCHGLYGRRINQGYEPSNAYGSVEVVLTRAVVCSRIVNNFALAASAAFGDRHSIPYGNGEDIILSFAAMSHSKRLNMAYRLPSQDHPGCREPGVGLDSTAIHLRWPGHFAHRNKIVSLCKEFFSL